jgi:peroxiredoxin Q/BCP
MVVSVGHARKSARRRPIAVKSQLDLPKTTKGRHMTAMLREGEKAPKFKLPRDGGGKAALSDFKGRILVLYFYPRADTPGCTREAMDFSRLTKTFDKAGASVLGVSADPVKSIERFRDRNKLSVALGSDESHDMLAAYGVWGKKSMYGRDFMGVIRATFLIGPDGRIAKIWPKVKVPGHAEEVLAAAKELSKRLSKPV